MKTNYNLYKKNNQLLHMFSIINKNYNDISDISLFTAFRLAAMEPNIPQKNLIKCTSLKSYGITTWPVFLC